jgi:hypothetical protein
MSNTDIKITATLVAAPQRLNVLPKFIGAKMMRFEALEYYFAGQLAAEYTGGLWEFYELSNGGFYMAPQGYPSLTLSVAGNGYTGTVSADAAGVVITLFALGQLAAETHSDDHIDLYQRLREFAFEHDECSDIVAALD